MWARTLQTWIARRIGVRRRLERVCTGYLLFFMVVTTKHSLEEAAPLRRRAASGSLPGRRAAARWRGWGVAPGGAGRLGTPGRAPQQGVRADPSISGSRMAGGGWTRAGGTA